MIRCADASRHGVMGNQGGKDGLNIDDGGNERISVGVSGGSGLETERSTKPGPDAARAVHGVASDAPAVRRSSSTLGV